MSRLTRVAVVASIAAASGASAWTHHVQPRPRSVATTSVNVAEMLEPRPPLSQVPTIATRASSHPAAAAATYFPLKAIPKNLTVRAQQIPRRVLAAYVASAKTMDRAQPSCHLRWYELAGIGFIESGHGHNGGSRTKHWNGVAKPPIFGPLLDGSAGVSWRDTDGGRLDKNTQWERAVGPMQFMPSTWAVWGADGNRDRHEDPQQIDDATLAAAGYLCTGGGSSLEQVSHLIAAVYSYNHSYAYVRAVLTVASEYAGLPPDALGVDKVPLDPGEKPQPKKTPPTPSASPSASPSVSTSPSASPTPTRTPSPTSVPTPSSSPSLTPSPSGSASASASATPTADPPTS